MANKPITSLPPAYWADGYRPGEREPVHVWVAPAAAQPRLTVLLRPLLSVPHLIALYALSAVGTVIVAAGWTAALFTGRLPGFAARYLSGLVRWQGRALGYQMLLTAQYPPFSFQDLDYPVRVAVHPGPLNRLAVLFRSALAVPALLVSVLVSYGALTVSVVTWFITLVTGKVPDAVHQALSAVLRYQLRVMGYADLLTAEYPGGLYGDRAAPAPLAGMGTSAAAAGGAVPGPPPWRLVLSGAARVIVDVIIVVGLPALLAGILIVQLVPGPR